MRPDFRVPGNRLGVAAGHYPERVRSHYVRVPAWANTSTSATHFFDRITTQGLASNVMRDFVANVRTGLESYAGEISDQLLWEFFCHLIILEFDFGNEGSRDRHFALETLRGLVSNHDSERSQLLYGQLVDLASTAGHTAGGYTSETLRKRLVGSGLLAAPACQRDLERLEALSQRTLSSIDHSVGGVVLDRTAASTDLLNRMERGGVIVLVGDAGVGKSALLRTAALARAPEGSVVALSLVRLEQIVGWEGLASRLQLDSTLDQLILSMSGTARPCLLIDGVDRIEAQGERAAVNDVLRVITRLPRAQDGSWVWSIILTTRGETLHAAQEWLDLQITPDNLLRVPELGDEEVEAIGTALPHLAGVLQRPDVSPVVRNLYFLSVFERARAGGSPEPVPTAVTEADVHTIWWERVVGGGGAQGRSRQMALLQLGEEALQKRTGGLHGDGLDPQVLHSLERDHVLRRDPASDTYWFAHDIGEDWTIARTLGRQEGQVAEWLRSIGEPYRAYLPLQFLACTLLERADGLTHWLQLLRSVEGPEPGAGRWAEAVITAPFRSTRIGELLQAIGPTLVADDGVRLNVFLRAVRTVAVAPDPGVRTIVDGQAMAPAEGIAVLMELAVPLWRIWVPVVGWLARHVAVLPPKVRSEASHLMLAWQRHTAPDVPWRRQIGETAVQWWRARVSPDGSYA